MVTLKMEIPGSMPPLIQEMLENSEGLDSHGTAGEKGGVKCRGEVREEEDKDVRSRRKSPSQRASPFLRPSPSPRSPASPSSPSSPPCT